MFYSLIRSCLDVRSCKRCAVMHKRMYIQLRIDCYFRAHMEYKRPDGGLKIPGTAYTRPLKV